MGDLMLEPERVLDVWAQLEADERLFEFTVIPADTESLLRANVSGRAPSPNLWTDAWLAALAEASGYQMVTFDRDFRGFKLTALQILEV